MTVRKVIQKELLIQEELMIGPDPLTEAMRAKVSQDIETMIEEEVDAALGGGWYKRFKQRTGYRHGSKPRTIVTSMGASKIKCPRARIIAQNGATREWESKFLPKYQRRTKHIDDTLVNVYLSGTNTRRIKKALYPILQGAQMSKSTISRIVQRLKESFDKWRLMDLSVRTYIYLYVDAIGVKARAGEKVTKMPVLAVVGVRDTGQKDLLALDMRGSESEEAWKDILKSLEARGLKRPRLVIADGNKGLMAAIENLWPGMDVQRCFVHKLRNLLSYAPEHLHEEIKNDYHKIFYVQTEDEARKYYNEFIAKWDKKLPAVGKSFKEAGEQLLTFLKYPSSQWRSLRSTNVIENLNHEFRRRVKTQGSFPNQESVLILLFALYASGQISMQRISGFKEIDDMKQKENLRSVA